MAKQKIVKSDELIVDNSILSAVARCPTYAYTRYCLGLNVKGESLPLEAGHAIHLGMELWMQGRGVKVAVKAMADYYERAVTRYLMSIEADNLPAEDRRMAPERVISIFTMHLGKLEERWPFKVLKKAIEGPIAAPFGETSVGQPVIYVARLDAIVRKWEQGGKWSLDHKSTRRITDWWQDKQKVSSQWSGQVWLGRQHGVGELEGVIIHAIELPEPHTSDRTCKEHGVPYTECSIRHATYDYVYVTRSEPELAAWELSARKLVEQYAWLKRLAEKEGIEGIKQVQMNGRFNEGCVFCGFKDWCRLGRPTGARQVAATFRTDPWDPRAVKE